MWEIFEDKSVQKSLKRAPRQVVERYEVWKVIVNESGPVGLRPIKGFYDKALKGKWKGLRSSRLNIQWRVLYKVEKNSSGVFVLEINPHQYDK